MIVLSRDTRCGLEFGWVTNNFSSDLQAALSGLSCEVSRMAESRESVFVLHLPTEMDRQTRRIGDVVKLLYKEIRESTEICHIVISSPAFQDLIWSRGDD